MKYDVIIIGAGAAGLFCASQAGQRGLKVLVLDHANRVGKKILMSGGGRCNFTNMYMSFDDFECSNPHFFKSALSQYTQWDFIALVDEYEIPYHEKELGQLFCDRKSSDIVQMLVNEVQKVAGEIRTKCDIGTINPSDDGYRVDTSLGEFNGAHLVIATGGLSVPTMGATGFGYDIARQFGHEIVPVSPGLVPFIWDDRRLGNKALAGVSFEALVSCGNASYRGGVLFTHRGLSGPAILKISSHWRYGDSIVINFLPELDIAEEIANARQSSPRKHVKNWLHNHLSKPLTQWLLEQTPMKIQRCNFADLSQSDIQFLIDLLGHWTWVPADTEGYRTAEVTQGGVDVTLISSKTMESQLAPKLYFIGEVLDVTGQLGGFNFQWAWSSAYVAAQAMSQST